MIPAGTLKYKLRFKQSISTKTASGFVEKSLVVLFECRASKVKSSGKYIVDSKELFHSNQLVFKIRNNKLLNELLIVEFENIDYSIVFFDRNMFDNSVQITLEKKNK